MGDVFSFCRYHRYDFRVRDGGCFPFQGSVGVEEVFGDMVVGQGTKPGVGLGAVRTHISAGEGARGGDKNGTTRRLSMKCKERYYMVEGVRGAGWMVGYKLTQLTLGLGGKGESVKNAETPSLGDHQSINALRYGKHFAERTELLCSW